MKDIKQIRKNYKAYSRKKSHIEARLNEEFIDHGIATIPCKVGGMDDIISPYSVPGYETLDSGFVEYISGTVDCVPDYYPVVLNIVGHKFTEDEQEIIKSTIEDDLAYNLGTVEKENKSHIILFICMAIGLILTSIMISIFKWWSEIPIEMLFVFFWFFADTVVSYLLIEGWQFHKQRLRAARLACMQVIFSEEYDESDYSETEAKEIIDKIL